MFRLISKVPYTKEFESKLDKFYRFTFNYDGSVSKLIENLSGEKLIINNLHHRSSAIDQVRGETLADSMSLTDEDIEIRYVNLSTKKLDQVLFARSYWSKKAYESIMSKNPAGSIGFNMIDQGVEQFRKVNWVGETTIKLEDDFDLYGLARSYSIKSGNETICQVEEYFTPQFNKLFY